MTIMGESLRNQEHQSVAITLFGGLTLEVDGVIRTAQVPKRLAALLAVIASNGDRGVTRDQLLALFWPDAEPDRARHALAQSVYSLRRLLGEHALVGTSVISIDPGVVSCDVNVVEQALDKRDWPCVVRAYRGPILPGFVVTDAPGFNRWRDDAERSWTQRIVRFLDEVGARLVADGSPGDAVAVLRHRVSLDPLDALGALGLMRALGAAGDATSGIRHAHVYERLVRQELELEPDPRVAAYAVQLHGEMVTITTAQLQGESRPRVVIGQARPEGMQQMVRVWRRAAAATRGWWRTYRPTLRRAASVSIALAAAMWMLSINHARRLERAPVAFPERVAIVPFRDGGTDSGLSFLPRGIVELLSAALAERTALPVVAGAGLGGGEGARLGAAAHTRRDTLAALAKSLGARYVVTGAIVGSAAQMAVMSEMFDVTAGVVHRASVHYGSLDQLPITIYRVATALSATLVGEAETVGERDVAPFALDEFFRGRVAYRRGDFEVAAAHFRGALVADTAFAPAALHLALASDRLGDSLGRDTALTRMGAYAASLTSLNRLVSTALTRKGKEALEWWKAIAALSGNDEWRREYVRRATGGDRADPPPAWRAAPFAGAVALTPWGFARDSASR